MNRRSEHDERDKFDHSGHRTDRPEPGDLRAPGGGGGERGDRRHGPHVIIPPEDSETPESLSGRRSTRLRRLDSRGSANR